MTRQESITTLLDMAAECFAAARYCPSEADIGEEYLAKAEALAANQGATDSSRRDRSDPKRQRKPSLATQIKRAEKAGRDVTSVTLPDGTVLHFAEPEPSEANTLRDASVVAADRIIALRKRRS